jgi:DNA-binding SARP family transcriptional activator
MGTAITGPVEVNLLRGFSLRINHQKIPLILSVQRLVAFLALKARPLTRGYISGALWQDVATPQANACLRSSLWRIQRVGSEVVRATTQELELGSNVAVDVRIAETRAHRLLKTRVACDDILTTTTQSDLSADILPDWYEDDWVLTAREHYYHLRLHALEAMCERLITAGRYGEAVQAGLAAVTAEPLRESAHHALIKAHLAAGNRSEALRQYERCQRLLLEELDLEPSALLRNLLPPRQNRRPDPNLMPAVVPVQRPQEPSARQYEYSSSGIREVGPSRLA